MIPKVICFGETLWDIFPNKKVIGGAPLNVALRLHSLGADVSIISCVGNDQDGDRLIKHLDSQKLNTSSIQVHKKLDTGNVQVHLDQSNTATYTISAPVAWDEISVQKRDLTNIPTAQAFVFGSLACRNKISKNTLLRYLPHAKFKVFDANLRPPFYKLKSVVALMNEADFIKLNDEELEEIMTFLGFKSNSLEDQTKKLSLLTKTSHICITLGEKGALLLTNGEFYRNYGYKVKVKDTVGAGDSFLASLIYQHINGVSPQTAIDISCAIGSIVASKKGANASVSKQEIEALQNSQK